MTRSIATAASALALFGLVVLAEPGCSGGDTAPDLDEDCMPTLLLCDTSPDDGGDPNTISCNSAPPVDGSYKRPVVHRFAAKACAGVSFDGGCRTDDECGSGELCFCDSEDGGPGRGTCVTALCRTDADCGAGFFCASAFVSTARDDADCGNPVEFFRCRTCSDKCSSDSDCGPKQVCVAPAIGSTLECQLDPCIDSGP